MAVKVGAVGAVGAVGCWLASACFYHPTGVVDASATSEGEGGTTARDPSQSGPGTDASAATTGPASTDPDPTTSAAVTQGPTADPDTTGPAVDTGTTAATTGGDPSLCARLGGVEVGIPALVSGVFAVLLADERINGYFLNSDVDGEGLAACVVEQVGALAGCDGVVYGCLDMASAHAGLHIAQQDFDDFVVDFFAAYDEHAAAHPELTADDKAILAEAFAGMGVDIVEDPSSDLTVYQRLGRKPGIKALIALVIETVADDAAVNGFFGLDDFVRLNTCLTRQIGAIDGPIKYGAEVDAPGGVDPGVGLADPCRAMTTAHEGSVDAMNAAITVDDFFAFLDDFVAAMTAAGVPGADQGVILAALQPLCGDIVADGNTCPGNSASELIEAANLDLAIDNMGAVWDDKYDGSLTSMLCVDLPVAGSELPLVAGLSLKVGLDHTFVGDLTIKVVAPDATLSTALSRPGPEVVPLVDNGFSCCGDDSNLLAAYPFTLTESASISGKDMGKGLGNAATICKDDVPKNDPCQFKPFPGMAPGAGFGDFKGVAAAGVWKVCFGDSGKGDYGKLQYLGLALDRVKYPPE